MFSRFEFDIFGIYKNIHHVSRFACHIWVIKWVFFHGIQLHISEKYQNYTLDSWWFFWIFTFLQKYCIKISFWYQTCNIYASTGNCVLFTTINSFSFSFWQKIPIRQNRKCIFTWHKHSWARNFIRHNACTKFIEIWYINRQRSIQSNRKNIRNRHNKKEKWSLKHNQNVRFYWKQSNSKRARSASS